MGVTSKEQLPVIEKALKLVSYFARKEREKLLIRRMILLLDVY